MPGKTNHFIMISDFKIMVPRGSVLFTLRNGEVTIAIAYTILSNVRLCMGGEGRGRERGTVCWEVGCKLAYIAKLC